MATPTTLPRCRWAGTDPRLQAYHDHEWGRPQYDGRALWEKRMLDGFQAGLSWRLILQRRAALRRALAGFEPMILAGYGEAEVARILDADGMIRSRRKIQAVLHNARAWHVMHAQGLDFAARVWAVVDGIPRVGDGQGGQPRSAVGDALAALLRQHGFKFAGPRICHAWAQACGLINDHEHDCWLAPARH